MISFRLAFFLGGGGHFSSNVLVVVGPSEANVLNLYKIGRYGVIFGRVRKNFEERHVCVCLSAWNNCALARPMFMKFECFWKASREN